MEKEIILNGRSVVYYLTRKRVKNINIRIGTDGIVKVSCPYYASFADVERFMRSESDFIIRAVDRMNARAGNAARPVFYRNGEEVNVFGERCTLHVSPDYSSDSVIFRYPDIYVKGEAAEEVMRRYEKWRRSALRSKVIEMIDYYYPEFEKKGVSYPSQIVFRTMKSRWGVCSPSQGKLTFNYNLFETPEELIAYVVVHELSHFLEANHSDRFWSHVEDIMPDYKARRKALGNY